MIFFVQYKRCENCAFGLKITRLGEEKYSIDDQIIYKKIL